MATFKDRKGNEWLVELDAPTIEEIRADHGVNLVNLETDPLLRLRNEPLVLVASVSVICRDQAKERNLSPNEFAKLMPSPPDAMLEAVRDAVIGFFPSGRASHVREVLAKFDQMGAKTDQIAESKIAQLMEDPKVMAAINRKANQVVDQAIAKMETETDQNPGT
jgi:hypothetical protein